MQLLPSVGAVPSSAARTLPAEAMDVQPHFLGQGRFRAKAGTRLAWHYVEHEARKILHRESSPK